MMKAIAFILVLIFTLSLVSGSCSEGEIDINSASLEELDQLYGIGPAKAKAIRDSRPIASVDALIDVSGIGPATLQGIKNQGLACAEEENKEEEKEEEVEKTVEEQEVYYEPKQEEVEVISLGAGNSQGINTEESKEKETGKYAIYGFFVFSALIVFLFMKSRRESRNEFR